MKRLVLTTLAAVALSSAAFAQSTTVTTTTRDANASAQITIAPEQRTKIKSYVTTQKIAPVTVKERVTVGAVLPADVTLQTVPADWGPDVVKYRYVHVVNRVVLVEPDSRKVVTIID